jgi:hypothetical protein
LSFFSGGHGASRAWSGVERARDSTGLN